MKKQGSVKVKDAIENAENYISQMVGMPDKKLEKHLDIVKQQQEMAFKQKNCNAIELLQIYEMQIVEARVMKLEKEEKNTE